MSIRTPVAVALLLLAGCLVYADEETGPPAPTFHGPPTPSSALAKTNVAAPLAIYTLGEAFDFASTQAFRRSGVSEANPLFFGGKPSVMIPMKLGLIAGMTLLDLRAQRSHHVKRDRILYAAGRFALTAWNERQARKAPKR
jgi:hypothetical protein